MGQGYVELITDCFEHMNTCDIIIPTYNGKEKLQRTIPALLAQEIPEGWAIRLIVSDDGSSESLDDLVASYTWIAPWKAPLLLKNQHAGRSYTRNYALDAATADILLLLADDMVLRPRALWEHLLFHQKNTESNDAALGCVVWDPRILPTPFMDWMMHGGQQNDYDSLLGVSSCSPAHYFYGSFISMKRDFLKNERFSHAFSSYGWEDLEFGTRLEARGLRLRVLHRALSLHSHRYTAAEILKRQRTIGSAKYLVNTHVIRRIVHGIYGLSGARAFTRYLLIQWGDTLNMPRFFALATAGEFWYGVHHANRVLISEKK